jgi:hypothetical protein
MKQRNLWIAVLVLALGLTLVPAGAQASPPIGVNAISFGAGNSVGTGDDGVDSVALGDLDNDGDLDIVSGSHTGEDYEIIAWQNDSTPFSDTWTQHDLGTASGVNSVALGDLDNDGNLDIVSGSTSGEVFVWQNDGSPFDGFWTTQVEVGDSIASVESVTLGDLDNDGDLDIISGGLPAEDYEVIAWQNNGTPFTSGTWTQHDVGTTSPATASVYSVTLGDLDNDGDLDIVSGSYSTDDYEIVAWQNDGTPFNGLWTTQQNVGAITASVWSVALDDLDNDGDLDIVSGTTGDEDQVIVWQNDSTPFSGLWTTHVEVGDSTASVRSVAVGDLDNDGNLDIVSGSNAGDDAEVMTWQNDGTPFSDAWLSTDIGASDADVASVVLGDLDNDGDLDIVSGNHSGEIVAWQNALVHRCMSFDSTGNEVGSSADGVWSVALGDLDNDGDLDIVSGSGRDENYEIIAWQNDRTPFNDTWTQQDVGATGTAYVYSVAVGDLDNDGDLDIVSGSHLGEVTVWQNDSSPFSGTWTQQSVGTSDAGVPSVTLGDLDNDGDLDIVSGSGSLENYEVIAWQNDGSPFSGTWTQRDVGASIATVFSVALGDLDNDGYLDIVSGSYSFEDYEVIAWQNDGTPFSGLWATHNDVGASADDVRSVMLGDLDNDGNLDVVSGSLSSEDYEVIAWQNDDTPFAGTWTQNDVGASSTDVFSVSLGDLDNDGDLDVVSGSHSSEDFEVIAWRNDGTPFSNTWMQNDVGASTDSVLSVAVGDLDNDGDLDIVSGSADGEDYELMAWQNINESAAPTSGPVYLPIVLKNP